VECAEDARRFAESWQARRSGGKTALLAQTTISRGEYDTIAACLSARIPGLLVADTICPATLERQRALIELCREADGVLVVGGKDSANTRRLLALAAERVSLAALIESPDEIPPRFFALKRVGIAAGASTPDALIDAVEQALRVRLPPYTQSSLRELCVYGGIQAKAGEQHSGRQTVVRVGERDTGRVSRDKTGGTL
jgi:(E)-4-hydroxy-3-methyl-but-2-enyl pyrophosphate reductase